MTKLTRCDSPLNSTSFCGPLTQCQAFEVMLFALFDPPVYSQLVSGAVFVAHSVYFGAVFSFVSVEISGFSIGASWLCPVVSSLGPLSVKRRSRSAIHCTPVPFCAWGWHFWRKHSSRFMHGWSAGPRRTPTPYLCKALSSNRSRRGSPALAIINFSGVHFGRPVIVWVSVLYAGVSWSMLCLALSTIFPIPTSWLDRWLSESGD